MKPPILVSEAMKIMDESTKAVNPKAFKLVFCTGDLRRGTGGERIVFDRAVLTVARKVSAVHAKGQNRSTREKRYPINVKNITSQEIRKVNIDLIEELNGHPVL